MLIHCATVRLCSYVDTNMNRKEQFVYFVVESDPAFSIYSSDKEEYVFWPLLYNSNTVKLP